MEHTIVIHQHIGIVVNERRRTRDAPGDYLTWAIWDHLGQSTAKPQISQEEKRQTWLKQVGKEMSHSPLWSVHEYRGEWRLTVNSCDLNEVTPSLGAGVPVVLELQDELKSRAGKWCHHWDCQCVFLHSFGIRVQAIVSVYLEWHLVQLEPIAPEVEAHSHHLPWTDAGCTRKGWGSRTLAIHSWYHCMGATQQRRFLRKGRK